MLADKLNYTYSSNYTITIKVTDDGIPELSIENNVTIFIDDLLHAPTDILLSSTTVSNYFSFFTYLYISINVLALLKFNILSAFESI